MPALDDILIFTKVAEFESISKAARSLGMPISTVSRRLSALESALGVTLARRNTRRITLTAQGQEYFNQCREPLIAIQEAERVLNQGQQNLQGTLRLTVPMMLLENSFLDFISRFSKQHARIRVDLSVTNLFLDLVADNIDVAIRFGEMQDSSVVATKVGQFVRYVVASRDYLKAHKLPFEPEELESHNCVLFNAKNNEMDWDLVSGRKKIRVHVSGSISSHDCPSVSEFVFRGHGVGLVPSHFCEQALAEGELVRLLPRWTSPEIPVFIVYPTRKFLPSRVNAFLEAVVTWENSLWSRGNRLVDTARARAAS